MYHSCNAPDTSWVAVEQFLRWHHASLRSRTGGSHQWKVSGRGGVCMGEKVQLVLYEDPFKERT